MVTTEQQYDVDLTGVNIAPEVLHLLPKKVAQRYKVVVFGEDIGRAVKLGVVQPTSEETREFIERLARDNQMAMEQYRISEESFNVALEQYKTEEESSAEDIVIPDAKERSSMLATARILSDTNLDKSLPEPINSATDIRKFISLANVPQIISAIMKLASKVSASDIHIEAQKDSVVVRFRIDGNMKTIVTMPVNLQKALVARVKILAKLKIDETRLPQDGRFDVIINNHEIDIRVSIMPTIFGEKVVMRLLDKNAGLFKIESLGITGENYRRLVKAIDKPYGVVMVTGPTGAGKSTTLYAAVNHLRRDTQNIVTLEDPVEYEIGGINQIQVRPNIGFTFAEGLSAVLRQDPNIIMVGEIRDKETANLVTHASLTGHLVLTTLHTNDAAGAMPRLINMGVEPFLIASAMNAIVGQRLVRKICEKCRVSYTPPAEIAKQVDTILRTGGIKMEVKYFKGKGCEACANTGYRGRTGIYEVLDVDDGMEELIISRASATKIKEYAFKKQMYPMRIDGFIKVTQGLTTVDEVLHATAIN